MYRLLSINLGSFSYNLSKHCYFPCFHLLFLAIRYICVIHSSPHFLWLCLFVFILSLLVSKLYTFRCFSKAINIFLSIQIYCWAFTVFFFVFAVWLLSYSSLPLPHLLLLLFLQQELSRYPRLVYNSWFYHFCLLNTGNTHVLPSLTIFTNFENSELWFSSSNLYYLVFSI